MLKIGTKEKSKPIERLKKLGRGLSQLSENTDDDSSEVADSKGGGGFISSMEDLAGAWQAEKLTHQKRAPEFWLKTGQSANIRIRGTSPVGGFFAHRKKINGKWQRFIVDRDNDLLAEAWASRRTLNFVWEVFDIDGYVNKDGKTIKDIPRFWCVSNQVHQTLLSLQTEYEAEGEPGLNKRVLKVKRTGEGKSTVYTILPKDPSPRTPAQKEAKRLDPLEFYAALSTKEQRALIREVTPDDDAD